jgi:hypothetical protein
VSVRNDPADNGGLFVGRRPGTAPTRFRVAPQFGGPARRRLDQTLAAAVLAVMVAGTIACWGPIPLACLWFGSRVQYITGSVSAAILAEFLAMFALMFEMLMLLQRLDWAWMVVRRAAGYDQRSGVLPRVFAAFAVLALLLFMLWFLVLHGPGSRVHFLTLGGSAS